MLKSTPSLLRISAPIFTTALLAYLLIAALLYTLQPDQSSQSSQSSTGIVYSQSSQSSPVSAQSHTVKHPLPYRVYLVRPKATRSDPNGWTVTFSNMTRVILPTCTQEDGSGPGDARGCVWPARLMGNGLGRSYVMYKDRARYFPARMMGPVRCSTSTCSDAHVWRR